MALGVDAVRRARARDHVLFEHHRAEVVGAEAERELADVGPLRDPRGADVIEVVEHQPREGLRSQIEAGAGLARLDARALARAGSPSRRTR